MSDTKFITPSAPQGPWGQISENEKAWIEFIRVISCGRDPAPTPERIRALRSLLDEVG